MSHLLTLLSRIQMKQGGAVVSSGYGFHGALTVDNTKVIGTVDKTNFIMRVSGTFDGTGGIPDLRTVANGGKIQNTDATGGVGGNLTVPADLVFSPNTDGSTPYSFEFESYNATTGAIEAWVKIPTLSYNSDTTLYVVYGDSTVTTSQEDIANVWTQYANAWHFAETSDGTSGEIKDSKGVNNGTGAGGFPDQVTGKIGNGLDFNSADAEWITFNALSTFDGATRLVIEFWVNLDSVPVTFANYVRFWDDTGGNDGFSLNHNSTTDELRFDVLDEADNYKAQVTTNADIQAGSGWQHVTAVWDASDNDMFFYVNGSLRTDGVAESGSPTALPTVGGHTFSFGSSGNASFYRYIDAQCDEFRISLSEDVDADWIATNYNTQNDPSTFYSVGSETAN